MPTKPNRAGNQQNYVPAGHGDASGEYGDKATGSNVHITIKRKDEETTEQTSKTDTTKSEQKTDNANHKERVGNYIKSHTNIKGQSLKDIEETINDGDEECNKALANALEKGNYSYESGRSSYYRNSSKTIVLAKKDATSEARNKGEVFYHESGHLIDFQNKERFGDTINQPLSCGYVSSKYNQTMQDMVREEGKNLLNIRQDLIQEANEYKEKLKNDYILKSGVTQQELDEHYKLDEEYNNNLKEIRNKYNKSKDEVVTEFYSGRLPYEEYQKKYKELESAKENEMFNYATKNQDKIAKITEMNNIIYDARVKAHNDYSKKYSDLSDMLDAASNGRINLNAGSHGSRYWRSNAQNQAVEFFAEIYSSKATKNQEGYDLIKKYFPKSVEIFEEIIRG